MRVRCPGGGHLVQVPADFVGTRFVCPLCQWVISLDPKGRDGSIQASAPARSKGNEPKNLEEQIYDGLPPLAVMMALKQRKGPAYDADDRKFEMTDDDWKALAAFESLLAASQTLRRAIIAGAVACLVDVAISSSTTSPSEPFAPFGMGLFLGWAALAFLQLLGTLALPTARKGWIVNLLNAINFFVCLIFLGAAAFGVLRLVYERGRGEFLLPLVFVSVNVVAAAIVFWALLRVMAALDEIEPPEITNRIQEALKYLE